MGDSKIELPSYGGRAAIKQSIEMGLNSEQTDYEELSYYTLTRGDPSFIHQHVVDAYAAQTANVNDKPIKLIFALIGLCLFVERQFTGRQVQQAHMEISRQKREWPVFSLPKNRGSISVGDVLAAPAGVERDEMIQRWCESVWEAYQEHRETVVNLLREYKIIE